MLPKELFSASGNTRGLPTGMETWVGQTNWTGGVKKKWTATTWANSGTNQPVHPRVTETNVYDDVNGDGTADKQRRTTIGYATFIKTELESTMPYKVYLPNQSQEYKADATTIYRTAQTDYLNDTNYWTRWIVGLPLAQRLYAGTASLQAQMTYGYDEAPADSHTSTIVQHDTTAYGTGFYFRGNRTSVRRYDIANLSNFTQTFTEYYVTGIIARAYYDTGAVTRTTDPKGAAAINLYDTTFGRLTKAKNLVNSAYTRYDYDTAHNWVQSLTTVNNTSEETVTLRLLDGAGRARMTVNDHPGSAGGLSASYRVFDFMGRVIEWSNPTEIYGQTGCGQVINGTQQPACWATYGDDEVNGYKFSTQTYDWNHRPLVTTHQDYATQQINYTGCGCAGGNIIEYWGEEVSYTNTQGQTQTGRRKTREYRDFLGRIDKTETLNWDGTVYASSTTDYNVRDQVTFGRAYQAGATVGSCPSGNCQETKFEYDGYGRLWRRWLPNYKPLSTDPPSTTQYDQYEYFANDTTMKITDPRGAAMTYGYNSRDLVTSITYTVPSGVDPTSNVTFTYDAAGNRLTMDDGPGYVNYQYDTLSRLEWEKRHFDDLTPDYQLTYEYNLAGQVKKITDPWGASISYGLDKVGRANGVTGLGYADINQYTNRSVTNFATGIKYRAWGDLKEFTNGNFATDNAFFAMQYDARLRMSRFEGGRRVTEQDYYNDGRVQEVRSLNNEEYKRTYKYDHAGRLTTANAFKTPGAPNDPYSFTYQFDHWGNTTSRTGTHWGNPLGTFSATWTNGRNTNATYDAAGHQTASYPGATTPSQRYDAAGRPSSNSVSVSIFGMSSDTLSYDGDGQFVRQVTIASVGSDPLSTAKRHYVRSSVLGGVIISELLDKGSVLGNDPNRFENQTNMYLQGERIAYQKYTDRTGPDKEVVWIYKHPVIGSLLENNKLTRPNPQGGSPYAQEYTLALGYFDPLGNSLGYDPVLLPPIVQIDDPMSQLQFGDITNYSSGCSMDGVRTNCNIVQSMLNNGWAAALPDGVSGLSWDRASQAYHSAQGFVVDWDNGFFGFVPQGATYGGNGGWNWNRPAGSLDDDERPDGMLASIPQPHQQNDIPTITYEHKFISQAIFIKCYEEHLENTGIKNTPFDRGRATLALAASKGDGGDAAMVAAIWQRESFLNYRPDGDAGPAQLTSWWRRNHPELIVGDSYGTWKGRTTTPFDGNPVDNITTLGNIVAFSREAYNGNYSQVAYWYGPGDPTNSKNAPKKRAEYRDQVMPNFDLYRKFFNCILQQ